MQNLTNAQRVTLVNTIAGKVNRPNWCAIEQQLKVITGKFRELCEAVDARDIESLRDAVAGLLVTAYGMPSVIGYDADADMLAVTSSLLSRFDSTPDAATATRAKYEALGVRTFTRTTEVNGQTYYVTLSSVDQIGTDQEFYPAGKFLKAVGFSQPVLPAIDVTVA